MIEIKAATTDHVPLIFAFIHKKAAFDRGIGAFHGQLQVSEAKLRQTLFDPHPLAYVLLADVKEQTVGFALYGFRYSSFAGQPSLWLDDLFVDETKRRQGAGTMLMEHLAQIAIAHDCTHLGWNADARNHRGVDFYQRLGAKITMQVGDRCFFTWTPWESP